MLAARKFGVEDERSLIGKPVDRGRWDMTPSTSNAYYNPLLNEIVFPAGILQPPAFDIQADDAVNYGAIGVVIGHEISHGFDDQGPVRRGRPPRRTGGPTTISRSSRLKRSAWWSSSTATTLSRISIRRKTGTGRGHRGPWRSEDRLSGI